MPPKAVSHGCHNSNMMAASSELSGVAWGKAFPPLQLWPGRNPEALTCFHLVLLQESAAICVLRRPGDRTVPGLRRRVHAPSTGRYGRAAVSQAQHQGLVHVDRSRLWRPRCTPFMYIDYLCLEAVGCQGKEGGLVVHSAELRIPAGERDH